jgi:hypothetical protein
MLRTTAGLLIASALLLGCSATSAATAAEPGARFYEQRRATRELRGALHPNERLPPPVCMRFPPEGARIVAVVLGGPNLRRVEKAFRTLHLKAIFQISSIAAYEAHLARLYRQVTSTLPRGYGNLKVFRSSFGFPKKQREESISFDPLCPRVQIGIHAKDFEREPRHDELAWTETTVRRYGSDYVSIFYGGFGVAD